MKIMRLGNEQSPAVCDATIDEQRWNAGPLNEILYDD